MSATKEQERKALEQIRKIVDGLGADSYLAAAFDGAFEDAEDNIRNDFACSWKGRYAELEKENTMLRASAEGNASRVDHLNEEIEKLKNTTIQHLTESKNIAIKNAETLNEWHTKAKEEIVCLRNTNTELEQEVIRLKAKLYDLMEKEDK